MFGRGGAYAPLSVPELAYDEELLFPITIVRFGGPGVAGSPSRRCCGICKMTATLKG